MDDNLKRWLLPAGIAEELPSDARHGESLRRKVLDLFENWGYEPIVPPLVEYLESLLPTDDKGLQAQTLKLTDHLNGRIMGLRADITPQVARIDASRLLTDGINRLCYIGTVLRATPANIGGMRRMVQCGAEIYGHSGIDSDIEIIRLMAEVIQAVGLRDLHIDIGHIGIYLELVKVANLSREQENVLFDLMHMKSAHEIQNYLHDQQIPSEFIENFIMLLELHGDMQMLEKSSQSFAKVNIEKYLAEIKMVAEQLNGLDLAAELHYDLAELGQYQYETGIVFSVLVKGMGQEIARGGRYDNIGSVFGRARAATGFSSDLTLLASLVEKSSYPPNGIFIPRLDVDSPYRAKVYAEIARLRNCGERVIEQLDEKSTAGDDNCDRIMIIEKGSCEVRKI